MPRPRTTPRATRPGLVPGPSVVALPCPPPVSSKLDTRISPPSGLCQVCFTPSRAWIIDLMSQSRDLFAASGEVHVPLAERLRPKAVDEMVGQQHLLGEGKPIRVALQAGRPLSMILWGPPGV